MAGGAQRLYFKYSRGGHRCLKRQSHLLLKEYNFEAVITAEEVTAIIDGAREFLAHAEKLLLA